LVVEIPSCGRSLSGKSGLVLALRNSLPLFLANAPEEHSLAKFIRRRIDPVRTEGHGINFSQGRVDNLNPRCIIRFRLNCILPCPVGAEQEKAL
jgi:hypothetical protein